MDASIPVPAATLLDFIASKEAPKGYNTVYANKQGSMPKQITAMTINEVIADSDRRTNQYGSSACGRYQFMKATLQGLVTELKLTGNEKLNPNMQDRLGLQLLKRRGYDKFIAGSITVTGFGLNIAKEWASFPVLKATKGAHRNVARGQSYYAGDRLNKSLVSAAEVETVLNSMLRAPVAVAAVEPIASMPIAAPKATVGGALASLWAKVGPAPKVAPVAAVAVRGDPTIFSVQQQLQARNYMTNGRVDGIDGPKTRDAVAAIRKDNGLSDGGIDTEFLTKLPTFGPRPVALDRQVATTSQAYGIAKEQAPDLTANVGTLWKGGLGSLLFGGATVAQGSGVLDTLKDTGDKANDILGTVQTAISTGASVIEFVLAHKSWIIIGFGIYLLAKAASAALNLVIRIRQARGI
jgi:muramidase (phage lysozyme)